MFNYWTDNNFSDRSNQYLMFAMSCCCKKLANKIITCLSLQSEKGVNAIIQQSGGGYE